MDRWQSNDLRRKSTVLTLEGFASKKWPDIILPYQQDYFRFVLVFSLQLDIINVHTLASSSCLLMSEMVSSAILRLFSTSSFSDDRF